MIGKPRYSVHQLFKQCCALALWLALLVGLNPIPTQTVQALRPQADFNADGHRRPLRAKIS
jgi:hypothetical protein